ncbi:hypothetical protein Y032_0010g1029 [Ancylostoma ceylanicum]|uniref:Uncharacterized protein n=1 Tax=Ancylostoma ceylanicum TaxID=53326 RepID=A0A016VG04_9BILA|nr:hypothetical protein Y032_0010g1029 [Ancylostoma ceylanicum]
MREEGAWPGDSDWRIRVARHARQFELERRQSRNTYLCLASYEFKQVGVAGGPNAPIRDAWPRPFSR